jgi:glucokinase
VRTLAIDIGGTKFTLGLFEDDRLVHRESHPTDSDGGKDWMLARIEEIVSGWKFDRCGIGFGGPVKFDDQRVALSTHVGGWKDFCLTRHFVDRFGVPAIMDNDANVGALGEGYHGSGRGQSPLFYMTLSTGIGGGILIDGKPLRGPDSYAGEVGHINLVPDGPDCLCGHRGCFERMCCGLWLQRDYGRPAIDLLQDPEFVRHYVTLLARGLKTAIMILNPSRIVIGGGIAKAGNALFIPLREELSRQVPSWSQARLDVQPAGLVDDSVLYGALELAKLL